MNTHARTSDLAAASSIEADALPRRRRWTLAEVEQAVAAGIIAENERIELIDGDLVAMSPKGRRHEVVRHALAFRWARQCPDAIMLAVEPSFQLDVDVAPEPDLILHPASLVAPDVRGDTVLLVVEVSDSSYSYDLKIKAPLYARFGVREYWVIDPKSMVTTIHRLPTAAGYTDVREYAATDRVEPMAVPELGICLADLNV